VTDRTVSGRSVQARSRSSEGRARRFIVIVLIFLFGGVAGYVLGQVSASRDIAQRVDTIQQLNAKSQDLGIEIANQNAKIAKLQADLNGAHTAMGEMAPSKNTYNLDPNQSVIVADGLLTVGLIGPPLREAVNINVNGKQHAAAAGDVIRISPDPSTACQVRLQSFDMFKAVVTATCAKEKRQ
jgi:hypothetical protein